MARRDELSAVAAGLLPTALVAAVFVVFPLGFSLVLSMWDWPLLGLQRQFVGVANWTRLLGDREFWQALRLQSCMPWAACLSVLACHWHWRWTEPPHRAVELYQLAFFMPAILSIVAALW
jgi:ABC-type sugar transport system permease subunit